jgi:hypothetical protein
MKLSKFLLMMAVLTSFSLLYVYQQTEILRLAYVGQKNCALFEDLLDKNNILRYNLGKSASLVRIGGRISDRADFNMPQSFMLVKLAPSPLTLQANAKPLKRESLFVRVFGVKRQAEAKTIGVAPASAIAGTGQ